MQAEDSFESGAVADVHIVMREVLGYSTQSIEIPVSITGIAEKDPAHVVVDPVDLMALSIKMFSRF